MRPASLDEAEELLIVPGTPIFHLERVRMLGGMPIALDSTQIPVRLSPAPSEADFSSGSLCEKLAEAGIEPHRADAMIEAKETDAYAAESLGLSLGSPILVM